MSPPSFDLTCRDSAGSLRCSAGRPARRHEWICPSGPSGAGVFPGYVPGRKAGGGDSGSSDWRSHHPGSGGRAPGGGLCRSDRCRPGYLSEPPLGGLISIKNPKPPVCPGAFPMRGGLWMTDIVCVLQAKSAPVAKDFCWLPLLLMAGLPMSFRLAWCAVGRPGSIWKRRAVSVMKKGGEGLALSPPFLLHRPAG